MLRLECIRWDVAVVSVFLVVGVPSRFEWHCLMSASYLILLTRLGSSLASTCQHRRALDRF